VAKLLDAEDKFEKQDKKRKINFKAAKKKFRVEKNQNRTYVG